VNDYIMPKSRSSFMHFTCFIFLHSFLLPLFISLSFSFFSFLSVHRDIEKDYTVTNKVPFFFIILVSPIFQALWLYENAPEGTHNSPVHRRLSSLKIDTGIEGLSRGGSASIFSMHSCRGSIRAVPWKIQSVARMCVPA